MDFELRAASPVDRELLVELIAEFYRESGYPMDEGEARRAFGELLADPHHGRVWIVVVEGRPAGYLALTLGFSLEYMGVDAFIDDFFLRPEIRDRGVGTAVLSQVEAEASVLGIRALHLEVERGNARARAVYDRRGFREHDRVLLTKKLPDPEDVGGSRE
jgi:GNAT superfamily N-acetyltransferase